MSDSYFADMARGRWSAALDKIKLIDPTGVSTRNTMHEVVCLSELGRYGEARELLDLLIEREPNNPWLYKTLTDLAWRQGDLPAFEEALDQLKLDQRRDKHTDLLQAYCVGLCRLGKVESAVLHYFSVRMPDQGVSSSRLDFELMRLLYEGDALELVATSNAVVKAGEKASIPNRIVQFWDKIDVPSGIALQMAKWTAAYPDFEYQLFSEQSAIELTKSIDAQWCARAIQVAKHPAQKSDIFRLFYLFHFGGVYVDADEAPSGDMRVPLHTSGVTSMFWLRTDRFPAHFELYSTNWFLASAPGSRIIGNALADAIRNTLVTPGSKSVHEATGPYLLTQHIIREILQSNSRSIRFITDKTGRDLFCQNVKYTSPQYRSDPWQDYAGVSS